MNKCITCCLKLLHFGGNQQPLRLVCDLALLSTFPALYPSTLPPRELEAHLTPGHGGLTLVPDTNGGGLVSFRAENLEEACIWAMVLDPGLHETSRQFPCLFPHGHKIAVTATAWVSGRGDRKEQGLVPLIQNTVLFSSCSFLGVVCLVSPSEAGLLSL